MQDRGRVCDGPCQPGLPDYPGFGQSDAPARADFAYTFGHYADIVDMLMGQLGAGRYAMYVMDYGAPVGYRLALKHPERVSALIVQNGNAYEGGLREFWDPVKAYWAEHRRAPAGSGLADDARRNEVPVYGRHE